MADMNDELERNLGEQPLAGILAERGLTWDDQRERWLPVLRRCDYVGVRGPRSAALLAEALRAVRDVDGLLHDAFSDEQRIDWSHEGNRWRLRLILFSTGDRLVKSGDRGGSKRDPF